MLFFFITYLFLSGNQVIYTVVGNYVYTFSTAAFTQSFNTILMQQPSLSSYLNLSPITTYTYTVTASGTSQALNAQYEVEWINTMASALGTAVL